MFGIKVGFGPFDGLRLEKSADGVYSIIDKLPKCTLAQAVSKPAWWLESGETILICLTSTSDAFRFDVGLDPEVRCDATANQLGDARCGCGPSQLLCMPNEMANDLEQDFNREPVERGLHAYENNLSWFDFLGGNFLITNRALLLWYMHSHSILMEDKITPDAALADLRAVPTNAWVRANFPIGYERAGIVTSPGYLNSYNTIQSRISNLCRILLCRDVDPTLNTDNIARFVNPGLGTALLAHGSKPSCSGRHYAMDNHATTLLAYYLDGSAVIGTSNPSLTQKGHVFGQEGDGPGFLMKSYVERGPGFEGCMAKTAWTLLTGLSWDHSLSDSDRHHFTNLAKQGPQALIQGILKSPLLRASR